MYAVAAFCCAAGETCVNVCTVTMYSVAGCTSKIAYSCRMHVCMYVCMHVCMLNGVCMVCMYIYACVCQDVCFLILCSWVGFCVCILMYRCTYISICLTHRNEAKVCGMRMFTCMYVWYVCMHICVAEANLYCCNVNGLVQPQSRNLKHFHHVPCDGHACIHSTHESNTLHTSHICLRLHTHYT
jgi:hypothetical protein